jgi:hypothetical protein
MLRAASSLLSMSGLLIPHTAVLGYFSVDIVSNSIKIHSAVVSELYKILRVRIYAVIDSVFGQL